MKRKFLIMLLMSLSCLCFGFSKAGKSSKGLTEVSGFIHVYGNEPFTFIGIETTDGKQYTLKADKDILIELQASQGNKIEIKGTVEKNKDKNKASINELKDGNLTVLEWKLAE